MGTARWWEYGQKHGAVEVLGTDIHPKNVHHASEKYPHITFKHMAIGAEIPLLNYQPYHLIFATFVLDTIGHFDDVAQLCHRMIDALASHGTIMLLRLHPHALQSTEIFREYEFVTKLSWTHGEPNAYSIGASE